MSLFAGDLESLDDSESDIIADDRIAVPADMKPELRAALADLDKARSQLLQGHHRAAIQYAGDALNRIAASEGLHGYATY